MLAFAVFACGKCLSAEPSTALKPTDDDQAIETAIGWLAAKPDERSIFEPILKNYDQDIDQVIQQITPQGNATFEKMMGREIKDDSFTAPELLDRNPDHPFSDYVPPH